MKTVRLGKTGMMVTRVGFGSIPIQRLPEEEAMAIVRRALELGINFIDTANGYGTSEERIGKVLAGWKHPVYLATKTMARAPAQVEKHIKLSLQRLGVKKLHLFQVHGVNDMKTLEEVLQPGSLMTPIEEARQAGVVEHIGISSHQIDVAKAAVKCGRFETIMYPFNFLTPEVADEVLPLAREHDVGFIAMKPLAGGMLDNARVAMKYLFQFTDVVSIPGIEKLAEIEEIAQVLKGPWKMSPAELGEMKRLKAELGPKFCHRCDYCQPCNQNIQISLVMNARSMYKRLTTERFYAAFAPEIEKAANCIECGECETRCPYNLPIRDMIAEQAAWLQELKRQNC